MQNKSCNPLTYGWLTCAHKPHNICKSCVMLRNKRRLLNAGWQASARRRCTWHGCMRIDSSCNILQPLCWRGWPIRNNDSFRSDTNTRTFTPIRHRRFAGAHRTLLRSTNCDHINVNIGSGRRIIVKKAHGMTSEHGCVQVPSTLYDYCDSSPARGCTLKPTLYCSGGCRVQ